MVGFVFVEKSPRYIAPAQAEQLAKLIPTGVKMVGLFSDPKDHEVLAVTQSVPLDYIQLHGDESVDEITHVKSLVPHKVIKALSVEKREDVERWRDYNDVADIILFDAKAPKDGALRGGNGQAFDWDILNNVDLPPKWMLSGGLNPDNVACAVATTHAPMVDVSSGVEKIRGEKDPQKIKDFIDAVKMSQ